MNTTREIKRAERACLFPLFTAHRPSFLIDAILEGHLGTALADDPVAPRVARLAYADVVIFGGDADHPAARALVDSLPVDKGVLPAPGGWRELLERVHGAQLIAVERFAFSADTLDLEHLRALARAVPDGFHVRRIDLDLARCIAADGDLISEDHVRNFDSPEDFVRRGIGFCALAGKRIVSGASSYAICNRGIEVQVNTHPDVRQRGLATAVSAQLLAHCLEHGRDAHWDAGNAISARLAGKLGYHPSGTYEMLIRTA